MPTKSQNFLSQEVRNSKSTNSNILSKEVLKRTSLQPPQRTEGLNFIIYFCKMGRTRPGNRQQRYPNNPRNRERFDELVELNGKIQEVKKQVFSSKFKPVGSLMNHLKEIEEQMTQLERIFNVLQYKRIFNVLQYNLTNDWYEDDRQAQQVQQTPVFQIPQTPRYEMKPPEEDVDLEVYLNQNFFLKS